MEDCAAQTDCPLSPTDAVNLLAMANCPPEVDISNTLFLIVKEAVVKFVSCLRSALP